MKEHSDRRREVDHLEPPESVLARAIERTSRQAKRMFAIGIRRRIPLGRSASIGAGWSASLSTRRTVTGKKADGAGNVEH